jgi:hypothetical protein
MAGVKVTDLPALGTAASDDIMYIVDTSTNTSKQIEVQNLVGGLPDIESGAWNPTATNAGGTNPVIFVLAGNYSRVGTVVTCTLLLDVQMDAAESSAIFTLDLPIASNFTNAKDAFGIVSFNDIGAGEFQSWGISADVAGNQIEISVNSATNGVAFQFIQAILQYVIIP